MSKLADVRNIEPVQIELGGKLRTIVYDMNAYAELEKRFGTVDKAMEELQKGSMRQIRLMLWVGLIHDEVVLDEETGEPTKYNITPYQVGSWITNAAMLQEVSEKLALAISDGKELPEGETPKNQ